jgi:DNA-binding transcriptional LysR family regulator
MDIRELESFCSAAHLRSFSRAARALKVGQSTVTKHIQKLEAELGKELFHRGERPVQLTAAGISLMRIAAPLIDGLRRFAEAGTGSAPTRPISVGCAHGFMNDVLLKTVRAFRDLVPHCPIHVRVGTKPEVLDMVLNGTVDLGITPNPDRLSGLAFQPIAASERVAITPLDHPLLSRPLHSMAELAVYPLVMLGYQTLTRTLAEQAFHQLGVVHEVAVEVDSMEMVKRYVELGLGIAIGHRAALDPEDMKHLGVVSLSPFLPSELVGIVTKKEVQLTGNAGEFVRILAATLKRSEAMKSPRLWKQRQMAG